MGSDYSSDSETDDDYKPENDVDNKDEVSEPSDDERKTKMLKVKIVKKNMRKGSVKILQKIQLVRKKLKTIKHQHQMMLNQMKINQKKMNYGRVS